ncbi:MAG: 6-phosphogluconolactonase [uncultured Chloroflexi bacterium]|uniref:6-phosphogluconolactonase n=1 Tax=uncultured Chloroflexota bacterium TaxID=166587 RepID=A0A6J4JY20_9CHLR|nr:MAG: 6-phosphogluconolactonase [uncultured Chloroflexota bacterium]
MIVYVGTNTGPGKAEGIGVFRLDESTGALSHVQTVPAENPTWVTLDPQERFLYTGTRTMQATSGPVNSSIEAYAIDQGTGTLSFVNRQPSGGNGPAYVSVHPSGRCVFAANYGSGHVAALPVGQDGRLGEPGSVIHHEGRGHHARRQEASHAHSVATDPSGQYVLACDLGVDRVFVYKVDPETAQLTPNDLPYAQLPSGAGPRHFAFDPTGRFVFVNGEMSSTVTAFAFDPERGAMQVTDTYSTVPEDVDPRAINNSTAQVLVHPNGRFVYVSNRGHDTIAVFAFDAERGRLSPRGHVSTQGKTPRNFNIHPNGKLLLAGNQDTHTIVAFSVDGESGVLTPTGQVTQTPAPICIQFSQVGG